MNAVDTTKSNSNDVSCTNAATSAAPVDAVSAHASSPVPPPPALRSSISSSRALAALSTLALHAKGLTSVVLQRPKFLTPESRAATVQNKPDAVPSSASSSSLSSSAATEDALDGSDVLSHVDALPAVAPSTQRRPRLGSNDATTAVAVSVMALLPWELYDERGYVIEHTGVRDQVLALAVYRNTFVDDASGEDAFSFEYARYKDVARRLLLRDPNVRDKYATLVQSATVVVSDETFWRNYLLRCNALRIAAGIAPYLPPVQRSSVAAVATFQRLRRDVFLKRRSLLQSRRAGSGRMTQSMDANDPTTLDDALGDLDLDVDGEIERELGRRRPSRAVAYRHSLINEDHATQTA